MNKQSSVEFRPIVIPKETIDTFLTTEDPIGVMGLYSFYYYTAIWQKTNTIHASTNYAAKALKCSLNKIRKIRSILLELGWIEDIVRRGADGRTKGRYIRVRYYVKTTTIQKIHTTDLPECGHLTANAYSNNNICGGQKGRHRESEKDAFDINASKYLHDTILSHKNLNLNTASWPNSFRLLRTKDGAEKKRIKKVLKWYAKNIGGDYIPVAHSAKSFRDKFSRLEESMSRMNGKKTVKSGLTYVDDEDERKRGYYDTGEE